jgi:hypothetical protein
VGALHNDPTRLAEPVIGRRFAPTRWLATLPFQGRDKKAYSAGFAVAAAASAAALAAASDAARFSTTRTDQIEPS